MLESPWALAIQNNQARLRLIVSPEASIHHRMFTPCGNQPSCYHGPCRKLYKLTKTFGGAGGQEAVPTALGVAEEGKAKVASFQAYLPLIAAICNNGLRERHWIAIADVVGFEIKKDEVGWRQTPGDLMLALSMQTSFA